MNNSVNSTGGTSSGVGFNLAPLWDFVKEQGTYVILIGLVGLMIFFWVKQKIGAMIGAFISAAIILLFFTDYQKMLDGLSGLFRLIMGG